MKIHKNFVNFDTATSADKIGELLESGLKTVWGNATELTEVQVTRVFPRKDGSFTIQYRIALKRSKKSSGGTRIICGHLLNPSESLPDYIGNVSGDFFVVDSLNMIVPIFPFDPTLSSLSVLFNYKINPEISNLLTGIIKSKGKAIIVGVEVLGYRLDRRCVFRYSFELEGKRDMVPKLIAKVLRPSNIARTAINMMELEAGGFQSDASDGLVIPEVYGYDKKRGAIFMENAPGMSLHSLIENDILPRACESAARLLNKLQMLKTSGFSKHTKKDELGNIKKNLELIIDMFPGLKTQFNTAYELLQKTDTGDYPKPVVAHRDFYDKQVLFIEDRSTLIDCDNIAMADPALDFGNFQAHLYLRKLQHPDSEATIKNGLKRFVDSYKPPDSEFTVRASWWTAASLIRLASIYILRPRWRELTVDLLNQAAVVLKAKNKGGVDE